MLDSFPVRDRRRGEGGQEGVGMEVAGTEEHSVNAHLDPAVGETHSTLMPTDRRQELCDLGYGADVGVGEPGGEVGGGALAEEQGLGAGRCDLRRDVETGCGGSDDEGFKGGVGMRVPVVLGVGNAVRERGVPGLEAGDGRDVRHGIMPACDDDGIVGFLVDS